MVRRSPAALNARRISRPAILRLAPLRQLISVNAALFAAVVNCLNRLRASLIGIRALRTADARIIAATALIPVLLVAQGTARAQTGSQPSQGYYTQTQADAGKQVFDQVCAICHGKNLQGGAGPALAGQQFLSVSQFQQIAADYFYHFISTHMPLNAPGSLSKTQYLDIMAYFLEANGYPSGSHELTANNEELKGIKIEPQH